MQTDRIVDKAGRVFSVEFVDLGDGGFRLRVLGSRPVAFANCLPGQGSALRLMDIRVEDGADPGKFTWRNLLRPTASLPLRHSGIGHQLLTLVCDCARRRGYRKVCGDIVPRDLKENPRLPDWYRRQGFSVERGGQFGEWTIVRDV